jgi:ParB family chromosome partitioning protein
MTGQKNAGNRGFGASMVESVAGAAAPAGATPARDVLGSRTDALSRLATGALVTDRTEWVDPARCRPWTLHNRAIELLDEATCSDLITSLKAEGRQRIPAIVRRLRDDPDHDYEIIAGVRRWWSVSWLRAHNYPQFDYLVTIQSVTDEEGFRLADVENRARKDISDLERARDYLRALDLFYGGSQGAMAERLNVSNGWMSRILEVGRLPQPIVDAFADPRGITARHAGQLAPMLRQAITRDPMIAAAERIAAGQRAGDAALEPHRVVTALLAAASATARRPRPQAAREIISGSGKPMLQVDSKGAGKGMAIRILPRSGASRGEVQAALLALVDQYFEG